MKSIFIKNEWENGLTSLVERQKQYPLPDGEFIEEADYSVKGKNFQTKQHTVHIDGAYLHFIRRNFETEQVVHVRSNGPYMQMHYEISNGGIQYIPNQKDHIPLPTAAGEATIFHVPELDGRLIYPTCQEASSLQIEISEEWLKRYYVKDLGEFKHFMEAVENLQPTIMGQRNSTINREIHQILNDMHQCPFSGGMKRLYIESKLIELLQKQLQDLQLPSNKQAIPIDKLEFERLHFLKELLTKEFAQNHSIEELSNRIFMNRTKMQAAFKSLFGETIHDFVCNKRMDEAYKLLTQSYTREWTVNEIARQVGYKQYNYFSQSFKKRFGISPGKLLRME